MRKISSLLFLIAAAISVLFLTSGFNNKALAISPTPTAVPTTGKIITISRCLNVDYCSQSPNCVVKNGHRVQLSTKTDSPPLRVNHDTFVGECFSYTQLNEKKPRNICTTGSSTLDNTLFGIDNSSKLTKDLGYKLENIDYVEGQTAVKTLRPMFPPQVQTVKTDNNSAMPKIPVLEWQDYTPQSHLRTFLAFQQVTVSTAIRTKEGGQQQAELDFLEDPAVCVPLSWDPDGRVFDSVTLDPIPGSKVALLKKDPTTGQWSDPLIPSRFKIPTEVDGKYGYDVPDGDYKLVVVPPYNYTFPVSDTIEISPNYKKVYLNPLAINQPPVPTPTYPITAMYPSEIGEVITVAGAPQHADIPLKPNRAKGYEYKQVKVEFVEQRELTGNIVIQGESSHPFTKIMVYVTDGTGVQLFKTYTSDYAGRFNITLESKMLPLGKRYSRMDFQASDLTKVTTVSALINNLVENLIYRFKGMVKEVNAQNSPITSVDLNQMPLYLEGYAYDASGNIMKSSTVGIYLTFSNKPSYETITDEKGYFKITSEFLPSMPFGIKYTSLTGITNKVTPEEFMDKNSAYLASNNINLYAYKNVSGTNKPPAFFLKKQVGQLSQPPAGGPTTTSLSTSPQTTGYLANANNSTLIILLVLIILLGIVGAVLVIQLMKKNQPQQPL